MSAKKYHIGIIGATGFTGRQVVRYVENAATANDLAWAIGGRDEAKLGQLRSQWAPSASALLVDLTNEASVEAFAKECAVILNLAGPYAKLGEVVVKNCIAAKTHYVDLTGEIFWVREMIQRYGNQAQKNKVKLIPVCGFECLPFDLGVAFTANYLKEIDSSEKLRRVLVECELIVHDPRVLLGHALSGGTTASLKGFLDSGDFGDALDPAALLQDAGDASTVRRYNPFDFIRLPVAPSGATLAPMLPAPFINPQVIHRTNALLTRGKKSTGYTDDFEYQEGINLQKTVGLPPVAEAISRIAGLSFQATALLGGDTMAGLRSMLKAVMDYLGPETGEGPPVDLLDKLDYRLVINAEGDRGSLINGEVYGIGHPGYLSTATICAEAAMALAVDEPKGKLPSNYGFTTPAAGLGLSSAVIGRMKRAGLSFEAHRAGAAV